NSPVAGTLLARLTNRAGGEPELQTAIASSAVGHSVPILNQLFSGPLDTENLRLMEIMLRLAAIEADDEELKKLLRRLVNTPAGLEPWRVEALSALLSGARTRQLTLDTPFADATFRQALHAMATNAKSTPDGRVAALRLLCRLPDEPRKIERLLTGQLTAQSPRELFDFSITELAKRDPSAASLLAHWNGYSPSRKRAVLQQLLAADRSTQGLLAAITDKQIAAAELGPVFRQFLTTHRNESLRSQAIDLLGRQTTGRSELVAERLAKANGLNGSADNGGKLFALHCAACHSLGGIGNSAGPDLASLGDKSARALFTAILDPNRAVEDRFMLYTATTRDGGVLAGMITDETATSITLMDLAGQQRQLLRGEVASLSSVGRSLMPEGLEQVLSARELADLVAHINASGVPPKRQPGNTPEQVSPAEDGSLLLAAANA
ncbi:MAG: c-type cytochrome, partial [Verrucomicrobiota bacterium]|nr:c-type cytochrome [Verrucomicrobiota bacterium]